MRPEYFEGSLQLRNPTTAMLKHVLRLIEEKGDVHIAKQVKHKDGLDLYLSSQKFLQVLGKKLQQNYSGQLSISRKLFSQNRQTSKPVYRLNVLFRHHDVRKGQTINYRGEDYEVLFATTKIRAKNKKTGKSVTLDYDQLR